MKNLTRRRFIGNSAAMVSFASLTSFPVNAMLLKSGEVIPLQASSLGFQGYREEINIGIYHCGNGYRLYDPAIKRFMQYDREMSPYGLGGLNGYCLAGNDPFNQIDPDGRFHFGGFVRTILGTALGLAGAALALKTAGLPIMASALIKTQAGFNIIKGTAGVSKAIIDDVDSQASRNLTYVSQASGMASTLLGGINQTTKTINSGARRMGLALGKHSGLGKGASIGAQIANAKRYTWVSSSAQVAMVAGETARTAGVALDNSNLTFAGSMVKFGGSLVKKGASTYNAVDKEAQNVGGRTVNRYSLDPKKIPKLKIDIAKTLLETDTNASRIAKFVTGDHAPIFDDATHEQYGLAKQTLNTSYTSPDAIVERVHHATHRHNIYNRQVSSVSPASFGFENLAGA